MCSGSISIYIQCFNDAENETSKLIHPTEAKLLEAAVALLEEHALETVTAGMVLRRSGVSKGSLYHHYADFSDLIENALTAIFTKSVDQNIVTITELVINSSTKDECFRRLLQVTRDTQQRALFGVRARRAGVLAMCASNARLATKVADAQTRLTKTYGDLFALLQERDWMSSDFDPQAASILIQAYTVGKIFDDISTDPVEPQKWIALIESILIKVFGMARPE
jgi:AcrR family transcriptional regulator